MIVSGAVLLLKENLPDVSRLQSTSDAAHSPQYNMGRGGEQTINPSSTNLLKKITVEELAKHREPENGESFGYTEILTIHMRVWLEIESHFLSNLLFYSLALI